MRTYSHRPWRDVPIYEGRDLASDALWDLSLAIARAKRRVAKNPPRLPTLRRASVSLVVAAVAAAAPSLGSAHARSVDQAREPAGCLYGKLLKLGDRGRGVAELQRALGLVADGIFGPRTQKAVRSLQDHLGLSVDGIVGPETRAALGGSEDSLLELGDAGPAVTCLQRALKIPADGTFGRRTARAVRAFQKRTGLIADGIVGPVTEAALGAIDGRLVKALALAEQMGLTLVSSYRPGAIIESSGHQSDHAVFPSRAIDVAGSERAMRRYARAVAGMDGVETVIHSPLGIWTSDRGWHEIRTQVTLDTHFDHVHVDTF